MPFKTGMIFSDKIVIQNVNRLPGGLPKKFMKSLGVHVNPDIGIKKRMGFDWHSLPRYIYSRDICYNTEGGVDVYFSRGLAGDIRQEIKDHNMLCGQIGLDYSVKITFIDDRMVDKPVEWPIFKLKLETYQQNAVQKVLSSNTRFVNQGIISFPTGGGKTITAAALLGKLGQRTLIVTHTCALVNQWIQALKEKCFDGLSISKLGDGSNDFTGQHVVVSTVQTLRKYVDEDSFQDFGCIILDECHHVAATTFIEVIGRSRAKYRYGLTASLKRKDGKHFLLHDVFGEILVRLDYEDVGDRVTLPDITPIYYPHDPEETEGARLLDKKFSCWRQGQEAFDFTKYNDYISKDSKRNETIINLVECLIEEAPNNYVLVLTKLREHAAFLKSKIEKFTTVGLLLGGGTTKDKEERDKIIFEANRGNIRVIIGTSIADEGLDIARLNKLILCVPTSWVEMLKQRIGRIARKCTGKGEPEVFDIVDTDVTMTLKQWFKRRQAYKSLGMEVVEAE